MHPQPSRIGGAVINRIGRYRRGSRQQGGLPCGFGLADGLSIDRRGRRQHLPAHQPQGRHIHRTPCHIRKSGQSHRAVCHRHQQSCVIHPDNLPRSRLRIWHHFQPGNRQHRLPGPQLGYCQRVGIATKIKRPHQPVQIGHSTAENQCCQRVRPLGPRVPAPCAGQRQRCLAPCQQFSNQVAKAFQPCAVAAGIQAEGGVGLPNIKGLYLQCPARIHRRRHFMPGYGVGVRAFHDRPDRHIQAGTLRQWAIMKVDRPPPGPRNQAVGQHGQVGHGKQIVKLQIPQLWSLCRAKMRGPLCRSPSYDLGIPGYHTQKLAACLPECLSALNKKGAVSAKYGVHCSISRFKP